MYQRSSELGKAAGMSDETSIPTTGDKLAICPTTRLKDARIVRIKISLNIGVEDAVVDGTLSIGMYCETHGAEWSVCSDPFRTHFCCPPGVGNICKEP